MYKQLNQRANISIEQNTGSVPCDGKYYVLKNDESVAAFRTLKAAQVKYKELIDELNLPSLPKTNSKLSHEQMMNEFYLGKSNNAILGTDFGSKEKKTGRFHKSR